MGWGYGYTTASGHDVAKFFYGLLGPESQFVSPESLALMQTFNLSDVGWGKGQLYYGAGLMVSNPVKDTNLTVGIGHGGQTYGYATLNFYYPNLKTSVSILVNADYAGLSGNDIACNILQIVANH